MTWMNQEYRENRWLSMYDRQLIRILFRGISRGIPRMLVPRSQSIAPCWFRRAVKRLPVSGFSPRRLSELRGQKLFVTSSESGCIHLRSSARASTRHL
jgi:hypothetical protein